MKRVVPLGIGIGLCIPSLCAAGLTWTPEVSLQQLYTSNVDLVGVGEEAELVTELAPSLTFDNNKASEPVFGYYRAQGIHYARNRRDDKVYQQALFHGETLQLRRHLKLEVTASHDQTILFPANQISIDNIRGTRRTNVSQYLLGPTLSHKIGALFNATWQYQFGQIFYHEDFPDSDVMQASGIIESAPERKIYFRAQAEWDKTSQELADNLETFNSQATLGYQIGAKLRPYASFGYDDYTGQFGFRDLDGTHWHIGARYTPSARLTIDAYYGERLFGDTYFFSLDWLKKRDVLNISYTEEITNFFQSQLLQLPTLRPDNVDLRSIQFQPQFRDDLFLRRLLSAQWTHTLKSAVFSLTPYYEARKSQNSSPSEKGVGVNAELVVERNPKQTWTFLAGFSHQDLINTVNDDRYQVGVRVDHDLGRATQLSARYNHFQLKRTDTSHIKEHLFSVTINHTFG